MELKLLNFVHRIILEPDLPFHEYPSLWTFRFEQGQIDFAFVDRLKAQSLEYYREHNHLAVFSSCYLALIHLLRKPLTITSSNSDRNHLYRLAEILGIWAKAASWYGQGGILNSRNASLDRIIIYKSLEDDNKYREVLGALASNYYKRSNFKKGLELINASLISSHDAQILSGLHSIRGNILSKMGKTRLSIKSHSFSVKLDDEHGNSAESIGLHLAELGFAEIANGDKSGLKKIEEGLSICRRAGHPGFIFQISKKLINYYTWLGEIETAKDILKNLIVLGSNNWHSYKNFQKEILIKTTTFEINVDKFYTDPLNRIKDSPLRESICQAKNAIRANDLFVAAVCLNFALERMVKLAGYSNNLNRSKFNRMTLSQRNALLENRVYSLDVFKKVDTLRFELRNAISHADLESHDVKKYITVTDLLNFYEWCLWFIDNYN